MPIKSLEEIKNLFQRLSVRRSSSPSLASGKEPSPGAPNAFVSRLSLFSRVKPASPAEGEVSQTAGSPQGPGSSACTPEREKQNGDAGIANGKVDALPGQPLTSSLCYEAESPDEAALVYAARAYQCTLQSRTPEQVMVDFAALGPLTFQLLHILPFDSVRKRMSVVVRHPLSHQVVVYTKGADSVIMELLSVASPGGFIQDWGWWDEGLRDEKATRSGWWKQTGRHVGISHTWQSREGSVGLGEKASKFGGYPDLGSNAAAVISHVLISYLTPVSESSVNGDYSTFFIGSSEVWHCTVYHIYAAFSQCEQTVNAWWGTNSIVIVIVTVVIDGVGTGLVFSSWYFPLPRENGNTGRMNSGVPFYKCTERHGLLFVVG